MRQSVHPRPVKKRRQLLQKIPILLLFLSVGLPGILLAQFTPEGDVYYQMTEDSNCDFGGQWCGDVEVAINTSQEYFCTTTSTFEPFSNGLEEHNWSCPGMSLNGTTIFTVDANRTDNYLNGVSALDLLLIQQHILGSTPITNPFKLIAADASSSSGITTLDIIQIRKVIIGASEAWAAGSWRFIPRYYFSSNPNFCTAFNNNPFNLGATNPTLSTYDYLTYADGLAIFVTVNGALPQKEWMDFYGIKMGDVSGNATDGGLWQDPLGDKAAIAFEETYDADQPTDLIGLTVYAEDLTDLAAFQMGWQLDLDALDLVGVESTTLPDFSSGNYHLSESGALRLVWHDPVPGTTTFESSTPLFTLWLSANSVNMKLEEHIRIDDTVLPTGFFNNDPGLVQAELVLEARYSLKEALSVEIVPNPIYDFAMLQVEAPEAGALDIRIYDAFGRIQHQQEQWIEAGKQQLVIEALGQLSTGLYFCEVVLNNGERVSQRFLKQ